ncbi:MAG: pyroglutamyl-peptidase I [Pseudomonadota bacterium]
MATVLLTGFEPYGNTPHNPAESVARLLDGSLCAGADVTARIVPSRFFECIDSVTESIEELSPTVVMMMGEFPGRATLTVERIAQNLIDATRYGLADNVGSAPQDEMTAPDGPAAYYATVPLRAMVTAVREAGIPADISDAPGTLMCNHLMYGVLHYVATRNLSTRVGWIHLPQLPEVAALEENLGTASMSAQTAAQGVEVALAAAIAHVEDVSTPVSSRFQI